MQKQEFHIVGIGASAGGLEALEQFFKNTPPDSHMAFVVIQHLDPLRHSSMPDIMTRLTKMPVHVAAEGMPVEPDSVYLIPPNQNLGIKNGTLFWKNRLRSGASGYQSISFCARWPQIAGRGLSPSSSPAPAATAPWV